MSHFIGVISNKLQKIVRVSWGLSRDVDIPSILRFSIHDVSSDKPLNVGFITFIFLIPDSQKTILSLFVISSRSISQSIVPMEIIVCLEVTLNAIKINHHIIKLF